METKYIGEHLLPGELGHFFVLLAFVASIVSTVSYFLATRSRDAINGSSWKKMARVAFFIQVISVFAVFGTLYYIISNHFFEYHYAWEHSSRALPVRYLLACFWEGQEGSFLLWTVWHCVLGTILIRTAGEWENPVMTVISFAQVCLASMLLGIYFFGYKAGSSPFTLLRNDMAGAPIFSDPAYLQKYIQDGNGLNPLLQNYWMVIHPPILFLGFASTIVPFSFAFAGLWKKNFTGWVKPALPWCLFSGMVLATGVMMGAAWAYESLNFGGYWAWDPVENSSMVPWLCIIAGIHTAVIFKHTGHSLKACFFFFITAFILVLYSTFLTRSGILGTTSVHAFTDLGMSGQLLIYLFVFLIPAYTLLIAYQRQIPTVKKEEALDSREFWMFIGSLVLIISAIFILVITSIPVWNKILGSHFAEPVHRRFAYNRIEVFIAIILALGIAMVQYLKFGSTPGGYFRKNILLPTAVSLVIGLLILLFGKIHYDTFGNGFLAALIVMMFASVYAIVANFSYILFMIKGKMRSAGPSVAHAGFGLMLLGILISSSRKEVISHDPMGLLTGVFPADSKENSRNNILLYRNLPMQMADYEVTYLGDSISTPDGKHYYKIHYIRRDTATGKVIEKFNLYPNAFINPKGQQGLISSPASKHYWTHDIYTYLTSVNDPSKIQDTSQYYPHLVKVGDTIFFSNGYMRLDGLDTHPVSPHYQAQPGDIAVGAKLTVYSSDSDIFKVLPIYVLRDSAYENIIPDTLSQLGLFIRFDKILPEQRKIELSIRQSGEQNDWVVLKAYVFHYISLLWLGTILMIIGFAMSIYKKIVPRKQNPVKPIL